MNIKNLKKDILLFLFAIAFFGFAQGILDSTFNNFLRESFNISDLHRGILELPREMPGMLVIFFSAIFFFLCARRLASLAVFLAGSGIMLIGFLSFNFSIMLVWLFILSVGQHIFIPLNSSIAMELAHENSEGKRLGQFQGAQNLFAIAGYFFIFFGFILFKLNFRLSFLTAGISFFISALLILFMKKGEVTSAGSKFILRKEYGLFYWLNILYGTRKQIFLTFAPWVLVRVFEQKTQVIAILFAVGGIIGIFFKPMLGRLIDRLGERIILMSEAVILIIVCLGYGFAKFIFPFDIALIIIFICYITDNLLMSASMARATYLKKIAVNKSEIQQTLTMGVSIDHVFSIAIALISSLIWQFLDFQYVFLLAAVIALINLFSAARIRTGNLKANTVQT